MAWETPQRPAANEDYEDRERLKFAIGLNLEGTVVRISDRKPSTFGGEVRYVDVDTTDGRKVSFGVSDWKLERFEFVGYQPGDGIRVQVVGEPTKDGKRTKGEPKFSIERRNAAPAASHEEPPPF